MKKVVLVFLLSLSIFLNACEPAITTTGVDTTAPVITVLNYQTVIELGGMVAPVSAECTDDVDTVCTVVTTGTADYQTPGTYTLTFTATDTAGNIATEVVTFEVIDSGSYITINIGSYIDTIEVGTEDWVFPTVSCTSTDSGTCTAYISQQFIETSQPSTVQVLVGAVDGNDNETVKAFYVYVVDTTPPVVTLIGDAVINLNVGDTYVEQGVDFEDNHFAYNPVITGTVDTNTAGTYTITYTVTDVTGNITVVTRDVIVS